MSARVRTLGRDIQAFQRDLLAATSTTIVTPLLTIACIVVFVIMVLAGVNPMLPTPHQLLSWGANDAARVVLNREYWRLPASIFLHGGPIHLLVNMWFLYNIGHLLERLYGNVTFGVLFLASGIGGAIASMATPPLRPSVGASGALFGMLGAMLAFFIVHRRTIPAAVLKPLRSSTLGLVIFNTLLAAVVPNIDQAAHLGGLATGFVGGLLLIRPWPVTRSWRLSLRRIVLGVIFAAALLGVGIVAVRYRATTLPPLVRFKSFEDQVDPPFREFRSIAQRLLTIEAELSENESPQARKRVEPTLRNLQSEGVTNAQCISRVSTPDPALRAIRQSLIEAQSNQLATIQAALRYCESGNFRWLGGADGVRDGLESTDRSIKQILDGKVGYLRANGLIEPRSDPDYSSDAPRTRKNQMALVVNNSISFRNLASAWMPPEDL
jgi:rhomboid protease GluP